MPKISVIIPVYKVEEYIEKCLDSVINQTFKDIEILVVNDGSPANEQKIIDKYANKDKRIIPFIKENGGLSDARNYGLDRAKGDYIFFIDSDDSITEDTLEKMYNKALENKFDMVVCDVDCIYPDRNEVVCSLITEDIFDVEGVKKAMIDIYPTAWNKLYKRSLLKKERFKKGVWFEDVEFLYRILPYTKNIGCVKEPFYKYLQRQSGSITSSVDPRIYHYIDNMNGLVEYYKKKKLYDEFLPELEYVYVRYIYATFIKTAARFDKSEYKKAVDMAIENVTKTFPNYRKNKYMKQSKKGIYLKHFNRFIANFVYMAKHKK